MFLSHLLIAGCDIGVQFSVNPSTAVTINFSVPMIAEFMKPCIVIDLTCSTSTHIDRVPLTYISCSIDFVRILCRNVE